MNLFQRQMISFFLLPSMMMVLVSCRSLPKKDVGHCGCLVFHEIAAQEMSVNQAKGEIKYSLPQYGTVRIRAGIKNGPLLVNIVDWQERAKGQHIEHWDWKDNNSGIDLSMRREVSFVIDAMTSVTFHQAPGVHFSFPESAQKDRDGHQIISGIAPIRVNLDPKDKGWLQADKYEIVMFIDGVFLLKEEEGIDPFTYRLDTTHISNGPHLITVNVMAYHGEIGVRNQIVTVSNQES